MEETTQLSEATSLEEFKTLRQAQREVTAPVAGKQAQTEEVTTEEKTAAEPVTAEKKVQETPATEKSVDDQIKELRAKGKHAAANKLMAEEAARPHREEVEKLRREMEGLRTRPAAPAETKPAAPQTQAADPQDPEPLVTDDKYAGADGYAKYVRDCSRWDARQEFRTQQEAQGKAAGERATVDARRAKVAAAKAKYPDFDTVTAADMAANTGLVLTPAMIQYFDAADSGAEVLYHLGKNAADYERIKALSPTLQLAELGYLGKLIVTPAANVPEKKLTPAVSRVATPPRVLNGVDTPEPKSTADASSFEEFKALRRKRT